MTASAAAIESAFGLAGKTALVTGAGLGLAEAIARVLAQAGARVIVVHDDSSEAERVAAGIREAGGDARTAECDPCDEQKVVALFASIGEPVDVVVIGAMMQGGVPLAEMSAAQWDGMFAVNARGAFLTAREAVRKMKADGTKGRIIALSTIGSEHPVLRGNGAYGASKAALNQLCRNLAYEHAADGICVNAILPGAIPGNAPKMDGAIGAIGPGANPERHLGGFGNPVDVGWLAVFLAGPSASYISGQALVIDGGFQVG